MIPTLDAFTVIFIFLYLVIIALAFWFYSQAKFRDEKEKQKLFLKALFFKIIIGISFALIYSLFYRKGDTFIYFRNASSWGNMLFTNPFVYFKFLLNQINSTGMLEMGITDFNPSFRDPANVATQRYLSFFTILGLKNYYLTIICLNTFLFILNWRASQYFAKILPEYQKIIYICILFIPSATFWGSGILKDGFTFSFGLLFLVYFHKIFFRHKIGIFNILKGLFCIYILISLKPYICYAIIFSGFIWLGFSYIHLIKNKIIRVFILPVLIFGVGFAGFTVLGTVMDFVGGSYSNIDSLLNKAVVSQQDLKQEYYKGSSFDIGDFDPTISGALSVAPKAVVACLFRPFIWEAGSVVLFLSALENTILLILCLLILFKVGILKLLKQIRHNPFLIFCLTFSISMALGVGLSTSNFGALVRFKIPMMPFFLMFLLIVFQNHKESKKISE